MKKTIKYTSALLAILTLSIASLPSATSVYANTQPTPEPKTISAE